MIPTKLLIAAAIVLGMSGAGLAAYAVGPDLAPAVTSTLHANLSAPAVQANASFSEQLGSPSYNRLTLEEGDAITKTVNVESRKSISETEPLTGSLKIATAIANAFKVPVADIEKLHNRGWGYGEIDKLYIFARESGKSIADIEAMRASGLGWGQIAQQLGVSPSMAGNSLGTLMRSTQTNPPPRRGHGNGRDTPPPGKPGH